MDTYSQEQIQMYDNLAQYTIIMQNGDNTAYNQIYNIMFPHVNALIKARGIDDHDVADIAQETMISVYKGIETIKDPQSTYKWVMSLTNNKITDFYRRRQARSAHEVFITSEDDDLGEQEKIYQKSHEMQNGMLSLNVPEDIYVNREKQQILLQIVKNLKDDEQQIIMMRCFSDTPFKEIADVLGCSESTVKTKFYRSLNKLENAIYDTEKKEGIRLHSVGVVPFLLFLFMQYAKTVPVDPNVMKQVTDALSKDIEATKIRMGKTPLKSAAVTHKAALIVAGIAAVGMVGGTALIVANSIKPDNHDYEMSNDMDEEKPESESEETSEKESETEVAAVDVDTVLSDYLQNTMIANVGSASADIAVHYTYAYEDALDSAEFSAMDGQGGVMGAKYLDVDGDSESEMIVGLIDYENGVGKINIRIYDYDDTTERINEITDQKIASAYLGNTNITCQVAYQQKDDGFYIYITHAYTMTMNEGGYGVAGALVWKLDDTGVTQLVSEPADFDTMGFYGFDTLKLAQEQMPTIVQQWYDACPNGYENDIFEKSISDMNSTPLIEKLSDMDSDYQELIYFGMMRTRDSNEWIIDYDNPVLYGYYDFYE